ncbi:MAG: helix-turn-helix transcriptional regulator [Polyangiaceae bacterium]
MAVAKALAITGRFGKDFSEPDAASAPAIVSAMAQKPATAQKKRVRTRSLDDVRKERVARRLERLVEDDFGKNQSEAAKALGVAQPFISDVISGKRTAGVAMLEAIADRTNVLIDRILERPMTSLDVALDYMGDEVGMAARRAARDEALKGSSKTPKQWAQYLRADRSRQAEQTDAETLLAELQAKAVNQKTGAR